MGIFGFSRDKSNDNYEPLGIGMSRGGSDNHTTQPVLEPVRDGNPNKYRFTVKRKLDVGDACVVEMNYQDCFNHDGNKILVYANKDIFKNGLKARCLDPHFLAIGESPVARFEPSEMGWKYAVSFARVLARGSYEDVSDVEGRNER